MSNLPMKRRSIRLVLAAVLFASAAFAADAPPADAPPPSKEMREQMAAAHDAMAACLRSEKSIADCRHDMRMKCRQIHGEQGCPMMGMGAHPPMSKK